MSSLEISPVEPKSPLIDIVTVSPVMLSADVRRLAEDLADCDDLEFAASAVYLALEYERLDSLGQLSRFPNYPFKIRDSQIGNLDRGSAVHVKTESTRNRELCRP